MGCGKLSSVKMLYCLLLSLLNAEFLLIVHSKEKVASKRAFSKQRQILKPFPVYHSGQGSTEMSVFITSSCNETAGKVNEMC